MVSLVEIPAPKQPESKKPEITEEKAIAQLEVKPKAKPISPEPPKIKEEVTETKVVRKEELTEGAPKVEVKTPEIETEPVSVVPPAQTKESLGEDISVSTEYFKQTITSRKEVKGEVFEPGESQLKVNLGEKEEENVEATYGTIVNPGEITTLPEVKEKESPFGSRPLSIMVENSEGARPQSGLDKANIVYEVLAEGGITRFLAIFYDRDAEEVGPIRSARPYFVSKSLEHQAIYVHVGGSEEAYNFIKEEKIDDINEFVDFQPFWRSKNRKPPHNLYTSTIKLRKEANKLGYIEMIKKQEYQFEIDINERLTGRDEMKEAIEDSANQEIPVLERNLSTLSTIGNITPLLGLLGTVFGMVKAFNVIAVMGVGKPEALAGGISEALLTTAFGLSIAIPTIVVYNYLSH
ncbi:unnamed protein product, partial [marine sediment metagenome]